MTLTDITMAIPACHSVWRIKPTGFPLSCRAHIPYLPGFHTGHDTSSAEQGCAIFFKIQEKTSKFYTPELRHETNFEDPQILGTAMGNTINLALCRQGFARPWLRRFNTMMRREWWTGTKALRSGHGLIWSKIQAVNWNEFKIHRSVHH